jgi:hypothetical protein
MSRRKNTAAREPSGKVQRQPQQPSPLEAKRLRDAALAGMRDPLWGTELGRLHLTGKIDFLQLSAGRQWAEYAARYSQALCSPPPDPKAIAIGVSGGRSDIDPDSYEGRREVRRHVRAVQSFIDAAAALKVDTASSFAIVRTVCERNATIAGHQELIRLVSGLQALVHSWGLTEAGKSHHVR